MQACQQVKQAARLQQGVQSSMRTKSHWACGESFQAAPKSQKCDTFTSSSVALLGTRHNVSSVDSSMLPNHAQARIQSAMTMTPTVLRSLSTVHVSRWHHHAESSACSDSAMYWWYNAATARSPQFGVRTLVSPTAAPVNGDVLCSENHCAMALLS